MQRLPIETVTLNDILITEELSRRTRRSANLLSENQALHTLARQLVNQPQMMLQNLVDIALELCNAGSAGVSLLETTPNGEEIFRWNVLAGALEQYVGGSTPRNFSPCGTCLERGTPVLFSYPERYFTYFQAANTPIVEGLVLPLIADNHTLGSIWIMSHDEQRHFDAEDVRVMTSLADFTSAALLLNQRQTQKLLVKNAQLEAEVAERRRAEELWRESEAHMRVMIENLPVGAAFVVDRDLRYLLAEGEALSTAGFKPEDLVGRTIFEVLPPELAVNYEGLYRQALAGEPFEHEHDAHDRSFVSRGTPLRSANGEVYAVLAVSYDISDRKQAEATIAADLRDTQLLRDLGARLITEGDIQSLYQEIMTVAITLMQSDAGTVQILDEATQELVLLATQGFEPPMTEHFYRVNARSNTPCGRALAAGDRIFMDFDVPQSEDPDGSMRMHVEAGYLSGQSTPLISRSGKPIGMVSTHWHQRYRPSDRELRFFDLLVRQAADLIEQRQAEAAQREAQESLQIAVEAAEMGTWDLDLTKDSSGRRSLRHDQIFGYDDSQPEWGQEIARRHVVEEDLEIFDGAFARALETGELKFEVRLRWSDGSIHWMACDGRFYFDADGKPVRGAGVNFDITDRKLAEAQLRRAAEIDAFRVKLSDALRSLTDPVQIQVEACRLLGEQLGVDRAYYVEIYEAEGYARVNQHYSRGDSPSIIGDYPLAEYGWSMQIMRRGETIVVADTQSSNLVPDAERAAMAMLQMVGFVALPLIKGEVLVGALTLNEPTPREWTEAEVELVRETAERIWADIQRADAETALHESEQKYRTLFDSIDEGLAIVEMIYDDQGEIVDIIFRQVNRAYERHGGVYNVVGRSIFDVIPGVEDYWLDLYNRVARTGESVREENYQQDVDRWFDVYFSRIDDNGRFVAIVFSDISDRKRREAILRENQERQAFLLKLSDILQQFVQPNDIKAAAMRLLGEHLGVSRAQYHECDSSGEYYSANGVGYANGLPLLDLKYRIDAFGTFVNEDFAAGRLYRSDDLTVDPRVSAEERDAYRTYQIRAGAGVPLIRGGKLVAILAIHDVHPHQWTDLEMDLIRETAERIWTPLERARAEAALRESEAKYRSLFDSIDAGFCIFEMLHNEAGEAIDFRYIETNPAFGRQRGRRPQPGQTMRELFPEAEDMWLKDYAEVARTGQAKRFIDFHQELDRWFDVFVFPTSNGKNQLAALFSDVTDERRSEAALRESEERLQKAISIETVGVLFFTLDGHITDANDTFLRMSGYSRDELRTIRDWQDLTPPEFWDVTSGAAEELATLGKTAPYEKQHIRKDGSRWWGLFSPTRLKGSGRSAECVEFVIDISDRKQAEAQLSHAAEMDAFRVKLADALRSLSDAPEIQRAAMRVLGEHLQVDRVMYAEIDDGETSYSIAANYVRGAYPTLVGRFPTSDFGTVSEQLRAGETFAVENMTTDERLSEAARAAFIAFDVYASVGVPLIKAGRWVANLGIQHGQARQWTEEDIELVQETAERTWAAVERAKAEAALRESEEKYRSLFEAINDAFALIEVLYDDDNQPVDCRFLEVSPSFEVHTGLLQAQGKTLKELIPSIEPAWFEYYHQAIVTNDRVHIEMLQEYLNIWFEVDVFPYGNPQDRRVTIVFRNINERKQAEADRIQLIREQAAREQERQRAESLAELDRAKTAFFSNVSHEFRTPLTLSLAPLQDALSDRTHPLDPVQRERLELVHRNSLRLLKLVNTLLDFSRIEAGRMEAVYEPTDLAAYTAELASVFRSAIERAGLQLIVDCPPLPEPVFVDREMWEKIVLNLLSNAFKFTFEGEIRVSLHSTDSNQVILQIQDMGTGIAPEHLPHLFERFYQVRGTQARTHEGSGIGLALVNELVRLQGGTIEVSSTVGEGTCFTVSLLLGTNHLPSDRLQDEGDRSSVRTLASTAMGATAYVEEAERWLPDEDKGTQRHGDTENSAIFASLRLPLPASSSTARVLVVDDNADMREYLTRILSEYVQVEAVADGATALAVAQERIPDLILSDVMMPGLDGFELLKALRADPRTRAVPIILLSARAGEEAIVEGLEAGADDYLIKPFSAQELISRVTAHLQIAQLRGEALQQERTMNRQKDEFISVVSHELNTPLVAILGWTRLLRSNPPSPIMLNKALDTIERNATLQAKLVQDLLDLSRISAGKLRLNPQPIELKPVIETAIATVTQPATDKDIHLTWQENVTEPVVVMGDGDRLQQVICNLLINAIKFTPEAGSVTVELSIMKDEPEVSYAQIRVIDTGIGICADFLPYVFDHFRQAEQSSSFGGLGLGLAIAHHLVKLHNGTINAESLGIGQGATFTVKLPIVQE